jgi:hypothetical protein
MYRRTDTFAPEACNDQQVPTIVSSSRPPGRFDVIIHVMLPTMQAKLRRRPLVRQKLRRLSIPARRDVLGPLAGGRAHSEEQFIEGVILKRRKMFADRWVLAHTSAFA